MSGNCDLSVCNNQARCHLICNPGAPNCFFNGTCDGNQRTCSDGFGCGPSNTCNLQPF
jgi:hypothetical protein